MKSKMTLHLALAALPLAQPAFAQAVPPDGLAVYQSRCVSCHGSASTPASVGPPLTGIFGQPAAGTPGYVYSSAMRKAQLVWDADTLDRFLTAPAKVVPGTKMPLALPRAAERTAVITYLKQQKSNRR